MPQQLRRASDDDVAREAFVRLRGKDSNLDYLIQRPLPGVMARVVLCRNVAWGGGSRRTSRHGPVAP